MRLRLALALLLVACTGSPEPRAVPGQDASGPRYPIDVDGSPFLGPEDAPVTLVEFGDFFCVYCRKAMPVMYQLHEAYPDRLRIVFKHVPRVTVYSPIAARVAIGAHAQGRFWEMHDRLFEKGQSVLTEGGLAAAARELGLDLERLHDDAASAAATRRIELDSDQATRAGARGTPAFFVNGRALRGFQSFGRLAAAIEAELELQAPEPL